MFRGCIWLLDDSFSLDSLKHTHTNTRTYKEDVLHNTHTHIGTQEPLNICNICARIYHLPPTGCSFAIIVYLSHLFSALATLCCSVAAAAAIEASAHSSPFGTLRIYCAVQNRSDVCVYVCGGSPRDLHILALTFNQITSTWGAVCIVSAVLCCVIQTPRLPTPARARNNPRARLNTKHTHSVEWLYTRVVCFFFGVVLCLSVHLWCALCGRCVVSSSSSSRYCRRGRHFYSSEIIEDITRRATNRVAPRLVCSL